ncbi:hypothetical protein EVAR_11695_1 [Eumeta japonica]|uniref:Uncharacterized protein n=1 Tax=Eumeta variegata TaxID=151549 RepID=A0A4C1U4X7_EUMVA|nr:hypothetical protein EVAR_11695_1 [Eumeta japonica]
MADLDLPRSADLRGPKTEVFKHCLLSSAGGRWSRPHPGANKQLPPANCLQCTSLCSALTGRGDTRSHRTATSSGFREPHDFLTNAVY